MKFFPIIIISIMLGLTACTTFHTVPPTLVSQDGSTLKKSYYHAETIASDGTHIRMTVYQPALKKGEAAPLLIHAHGFAIGRMERPVSIYGKLLIAGKASLRAWDDGYWVISYDSRGMGDSQGQIALMDPTKEPKDVSAVIDWALKNLPISQKNEKPLIGMIGESYGGGVQMSATLQEPRLTALIPMTTWYDLRDALFPQGVPKTDWLAFLGVVGYTLGPLQMDHRAAKSTIKEILGKGDPAFLNRLYNNSLAAHCDDAEGPQADALLIQGINDVLFPFNQALKARACFLRHRHDARLIAIEHGHLQPTSQLSPSLPIWYMQERVRCNDQVYQVADIINDWLNGKLRDDHAALNRVPNYCVTGEKSVDEHSAELTWLPLEKVTSHNSTTGWFEMIAKPMESIKNVFVPECLPTPPQENSTTPPSPCVPLDWKQPSDGWLRPARIPIYSATAPTWIAGVPHVRLTVDNTNRQNATLFLRLAIRKPNSGSYRILSSQVTPMRANGELDFELNAVRDKLLPGEVIGLLAQGHSSQFHLSGSGLGTHISISGQIGLPLAPAKDATPYEWKIKP